MLWFGFAVSVEALLQDFTSAGKVFWIFYTEAAGRVMGPIPTMASAMNASLV
jgi:hypothetical protein